MAENPVFSYTRRDYEGARKEGLAKIPILSSGNWTDLNATDPGVIILDYVHALVDMVNYYQDHQALEAFIVTAKERSNIFRLAKQLSYDIRSAKGAICDVVFTSALLHDHPIKIPKYTSIKTASGINYLTMEEAYLPTRTTQISIPCTQGVIAEKTYTGTGISRYSTIEDAEDQIAYLPSSNIDIDSISITDNLGNIWNQIDYIAFAGPSEKVYQLELTAVDSIFIRFGNGNRGAIPRTTDILTIKYIITQAEEGRVGANSLISLENKIIDTNGTYIEFTVTNPQASTGGSRAQSSSSIKELAPGAIKAQNRAVTLHDFENLAKLIDGVSDAKAYDINTLEGCLYHEVKVLIVPEDPTGSIELLKTRVYDYLYKRMIPPTNLQILTPSIVPINLNVSIRKLDTGVASRVEYNVRQAINDYFNNLGHIGESFYPSDLLATLSTVEGVRYIISLTPNSPVQISELSIASLGNITITVE